MTAFKVKETRPHRRCGRCRCQTLSPAAPGGRCFLRSLHGRSRRHRSTLPSDGSQRLGNRTKKVCIDVTAEAGRAIVTMVGQ